MKTTVRVILYREDGCILAGTYFAGQKKKGQVGFPGGGAEEGETLYETAYREVIEETGLSSEHFSIVSEEPFEILTETHRFVFFKGRVTGIPSDTEEMGAWQFLKPEILLALESFSDFCRQGLEQTEQQG